MSRSIPASALVLGTFLLAGAGLRADEALDDVIFAGDSTSYLQLAVQEGVLTIQTIGLRQRILAQDIDALLVPGQQPKDHEMVRYSEPGITSLTDLRTVAGDVGRLREFAQSTILKATWSLKSAPPNPAKFDALFEAVAAQPEARKQATERFVGAALADLPTTPPGAQVYVSKYRNHVERNVADLLTGASDSLLPANVPYAFPQPKVPLAELRKLTPEDVGSLRVDGQEYKTGWVGPHLIIVRPGEQAMSHGPKAPEGLKKLQVSPSTAKQVMGLNPGNKAAVPSLIGAIQKGEGA